MTSAGAYICVLFVCVVSCTAGQNTSHFHNNIVYTDATPGGRYTTNFTRVDVNESVKGNFSGGDVRGRQAAGLHFMFGRGTLYNLPLYATPFVIIFGVLGNIIAFIVLFRFVKEQRSPSDLHLCALALFDIGGLLFSSLLFWLSSFLRLELFLSNQNRILDIVMGSYGACQVWFYVSFFFRYCSHWMVVIFTVERYFIIANPFDSKTFTLKRAAWKILTLVCVSAVVNVVTFWMFGKRATPGGDFCKWGEVFYIATFVHLTLMCLVPSVLIVVFNVAIVRALSNHRAEDPRVGDTDDAKERELQITWRLLAVSVTFVVLTFPFMIVAFYRNALRLQGVRHFSVLVSDFYSVAAFLYMCNYAVNFICYCGTGARFRLAVKELLCCKSRANNRDSVPTDGTLNA